MGPMNIDIALYEPEIPPNTGNIIRLCANSGANLHLIEPFGFEWDDKRLRRAGLDYHALTHVVRHKGFGPFEANAAPQRLVAFTTKAARSFNEFEYAPGDTLLFGPETRGLPIDVLDHVGSECCVRIPMRKESRSLNLANAVAIALYEAWRQLGYEGAV